MNKLSFLHNLSKSQREAYNLLVNHRFIRAEGKQKRSFRVLWRLGLVKNNPDSDNKNEWVLDGKHVDVPPKLPKTKYIVEGNISNIIEDKPKPRIRRPPADHTNPSREYFIEKWSSVDVKTGDKAMVKVKCLSNRQMEYIMDNHVMQTAQVMAEYLKVEKYSVNIFCQANDIEAYKPTRKHKPKDDYHTISPERLRRMKRLDYNGSQKKTA